MLGFILVFKLSESRFSAMAHPDTHMTQGHCYLATEMANLKCSPKLSKTHGGIKCIWTLIVLVALITKQYWCCCLLSPPVAPESCSLAQ